jgi:hypothetical protein
MMAHTDVLLLYVLIGELLCGVCYLYASARKQRIRAEAAEKAVISETLRADNAEAAEATERTRAVKAEGKCKHLNSVLDRTAEDYSKSEGQRVLYTLLYERACRQKTKAVKRAQEAEEAAHEAAAFEKEFKEATDFAKEQVHARREQETVN